MARDKERQVNPAQQHHKLQKAKQLKKSRTELQNRRNEKLARRNPDRIQRQVDDLKALETAGDIKPRERAILADLERDLKAIRKAKEALGESSAPPREGHRGDSRHEPQRPGKRRHDDGQVHRRSRRKSSESDTDDSVRRIPMPEDTPPPIPRAGRQTSSGHGRIPERDAPTSSQSEPPTKVAKLSYESAPQLRDLRKEAVGRFVPNIVRQKQQAAAGGGTGHLIEPEEMDCLESEGYSKLGGPTQTALPSRQDQRGTDEASKELEDQEHRFRMELEEDFHQGVATATGQERGAPPPNAPSAAKQKSSWHVEIEEVEDEDA